MTREEAARTLDPKTTEEAYNDITHGYASKYWFSKWYNAKSEACKMGAEALRALDAQEKQESFGEWISVKDGLPEEKEPVIILLQYGHVFRGEIRERQSLPEWWYYYDAADTDIDMLGYLYPVGGGLWFKENPVIAWMPLPEPPKEGNP